MATERLRVILEMVTGQYQAGAKQAATETGRLSQSVGKATAAAGTLKAAFVGVGSVLAAGAGLKQLGELAAEDAKQQDVLAQTLRNTTGATKEQIDANEEWISSFSKSVGIADDKLRPAFGLLAIAGRSVEQSQKDMAVAADIAAARNLDLATVSTAMSKAAQGQTTALRRLGIQTTDAAGAALTYDQILQNAAATMGGTATKGALSLGGQLERQKIQWEETKESLGGVVLPQLNRLGDLFGELTTAVSGGNAAVAQSTTYLNELVRNGIDPTSNRVAALISVLGEVSDNMDDIGGSAKFVAQSISATDQDVLEAISGLQEYGVGWGYSEKQIKAMTDELKIYVTNQDYANQRTAAGTKSQTDYAAAVRDSRLALAESADTALAFFSANERLVDAQRAYTEAVSEFGPVSDEARGAFTNLVKAQADTNASQKALAEEGTPIAIEALRKMAIQAGLSREEVDKLILSMFGVVGVASSFRDLPPLEIRTKLSTAGGNAVRAHGGPVSAGRTYTVGERGPETFTPNTSGRIIPNNMLGQGGGGNVSIVVNSPTTPNLDRSLAYASLMAGLMTQVGA